MATLDGTEAVSVLQGALRGSYIDRGAPEYDSARALYNAMIDRRPQAIVHCADAADVIAALALRPRARPAGGGPRRRSQRRRAGQRRRRPGDRPVADARACASTPRRGPRASQGGATLGDVDHATHAFGLAVPAGIISTTGVGGLTLGGGSATSPAGAG